MRLTLLTILMIAPRLFAQNGANCQQAGGAILTNFLDPSTTLGSATGDFKGGIAVTVLTAAPGPNGSTVFHNQHRWVTESGDTIALAEADATASPAQAGAVSAIVYVKGVQVTGGTGRFAGASGSLAIFGAINGEGQLVLRYQGQVCFKPVPAH